MPTPIEIQSITLNSAQTAATEVIFAVCPSVSFNFTLPPTVTTTSLPNNLIYDLIVFNESNDASSGCTLSDTIGLMLDYTPASNSNGIIVMLMCGTTFIDIASAYYSNNADVPNLYSVSINMPVLPRLPDNYNYTITQNQGSGNFGINLPISSNTVTINGILFDYCNSEVTSNSGLSCPGGPTITPEMSLSYSAAHSTKGLALSVEFNVTGAGCNKTVTGPVSIKTYPSGVPIV